MVFPLLHPTNSGALRVALSRASRLRMPHAAASGRLIRRRIAELPVDPQCVADLEGPRTRRRFCP
jgi:hypothetical protein